MAPPVVPPSSGAVNHFALAVMDVIYVHLVGPHLELSALGVLGDAEGRKGAAADVTLDSGVL